VKKSHHSFFVAKKKENKMNIGKVKRTSPYMIYRFFCVMILAWLISMAGNTSSYATTVTLQWGTSSGATGYKVYYQEDSLTLPFNGTGASEGASPVDATSSNNATITGLDPSHAYYFAVTAYNASGESTYSNIVSVPELVSPTVSLTSPANNASVSGTVSVNASASDNLGVTKVEFYVNGTLKSTDTSTPYLYSWNTSSLTAGSYTLMAKAYDAAGNVGQTTNLSVTIVNDTVSPTVSVTAPANNATVSGNISVTANADDNVGVSKVEFYEDGALLSATNIAPYSYSWNSTTVTDGTHTLYAKAYDAAGNIKQSSNVTVTVRNDNTPPTVSISSPSNSAIVSGTVSVTTSASDNIGVSKVEFYVNGALQSTDTTSPYTFSWNTTSVANGSYTLSAKAYDAANNVGSSSSVTVTVNNPDTTVPTASISSPSNNATINGTVSVTATASDNVGVAKVEFYVNASLQATDTSSPYSFSWNTTSVANGSYTLSAKAYDAASNVGSSANVSVTVNNTDTTVPTVSISSPSNSATINGTVSVTATASDNVGVAKVEFYVNGALQATDTSSPYSFSWNTTSVANGSCTLSAKAYDAAGNVGQSQNVALIVINSGSGSGTYTVIFGNAADSSSPNTVEDTYLNLSSSAYSSTTSLLTYTWPANKPANSILMKWNISSLPANAQIQSATLSLFMTESGGDSLYTIPVSQVINKSPVIASCNGYKYDGTNSWDPSSIPYNSIPLAQSNISAPVDAPQINTTVGYKSWNLTSIVQDWMANPGRNFGLLLNSSTNASSDSYRYFASSEAADTTQRPKLVVTYVLVTDTTAPTASIISPINNATINGSQTITVNASDNIAVSKVEFYVNGALQVTDTTSPYSFSWNTTSVANGSYTLSAKAYDAAGNIGQSSNVTVTVSNSSPTPTVSITSPTNGATYNGSATISLTASATANGTATIAKVEFYNGSVLLNSDTTSPYTFTWSNVPKGTYTITAKAYDSYGATKVSAPITVNVVSPATAVSFTSVSAASPRPVGTSVTFNAKATGGSGTYQYQFLVKNPVTGWTVAKAYSTSSSFAWITSALPVGTYSIQVMARNVGSTISYEAWKTIKYVLQ
jgi:hypothetical protein